MDTIPAHDLTIEAWPPRCKTQGGQHVGTGPNGVKITHLPSGIAVTCAHGRSPFINRKIAMAALEGALTCPAFQ